MNLTPYTQFKLKNKTGIYAFSNWVKKDVSFLCTQVQDPTKIPNLGLNLYLNTVDQIEGLVSPSTSPYLTTVTDLIRILESYPKNTVVMTNQNGRDWSEFHPINPCDIKFSPKEKLIKVTPGNGWERLYDDDSDDEEIINNSDVREHPVLELYS